MTIMAQEGKISVEKFRYLGSVQQRNEGAKYKLKQEMSC